jgi:hypothetical protein
MGPKVMTTSGVRTAITAAIFAVSSSALAWDTSRSRYPRKMGGLAPYIWSTVRSSASRTLGKSSRVTS